MIFQKTKDCFKILMTEGYICLKAFLKDYTILKKNTLIGRVGLVYLNANEYK